MKRAAWLLMAALALSGLAGRAQEPGARLQLYSDQETLATIPPGLAAASLRVSPDSARVAFAIEQKRARMFVDGRPGPAFAGVSYPYFSPDSRRLAYVAIGKRKARLLLNGKPGRRYDEIGIPVFSADSRHLAYPASRKEEWFVVLDGKPGPAFERVGEIRLAVGDAGVSLAYRAQRGETPLLILAGARNAEITDALPAGEFGFSPDGAHFAYVAGTEKQQRLVLDGKAGPDFDRVRLPVFSQDSQRYAYQLQQGGKLDLFFEGKRLGPLWDGVGQPLFSPDSRRFLYVVKLAGQLRVVVDGKVGPGYDGLARSGAVFSPDSQHFAYPARQGDDHFIVVDQQPGPRLQGVVRRTLAFSPDSHHLAYGARVGKQEELRLDHVSLGLFDRLGPNSFAFSPDSAHLACWTYRRRGWRVCVDGVEAPGSFSGFLSGSRLVWEDATHVRGLAMVNNVIYRVTVSVGSRN